MSDARVSETKEAGPQDTEASGEKKGNAQRAFWFVMALEPEMATLMES